MSQLGVSESGGVTIYAPLRLRLTAAYGKSPFSAGFRGVNMEAVVQQLSPVPAPKGGLCAASWGGIRVPNSELGTRLGGTQLGVQWVRAWGYPTRSWVRAFGGAAAGAKWSALDAASTVPCSIVACRRVMSKACRLMDSRREGVPGLLGLRARRLSGTDARGAAPRRARP